MEHITVSDDDDDGSTILIESDADLYDSDVTEISDDEETDVQIQNPRELANRGYQEQATRSLVSLPPPTVQHALGEGTQSDSESLLVVPQATGSNQTNLVRTGSNQPGPSSDIPGPSGVTGVSHTDPHSTLSLVRTSQRPVATDQSGAGTVEHANEPRSSSQSDARSDGGSTRDGSQGQNSSGNSSHGSSTDNSQGSNGDGGNNEMRGAAANQIEGDGDDNEGDEPMEQGGVADEDESSNDSMNDFQEPKKSAALAALNDSLCSSDDESQSCIICYESWTTSGAHRLVSLKCGHLFGQSCIEQWLKGQGGKCPQCNSKAKKSDIRVIYAKALKAIDTSERDRAMRELEREKELRKKAEMDAAQTQLRYVMAMEDVKRMKAILDAQQKSAARSNFSGLGASNTQGSSAQASGYYMVERNIQVSANGSCRVVAFDAANQLLLASMQSPNSLFQGYGLKKISAMDFKTCQYLPIHSKPIRGLAFSGRNDGLVLSASVDKMLKITSLASNTVVQSYTCPMPVWCCAWNSTNTNYIYAGMQNGAIMIYDTRKADGVVQTLSRDGSRCPIVSVKYVPSSTNVSFPCAGLVIGTLEGASFWEQLVGDEYRLHKLQLEGSCTGVTFEPNTRHCLASFRPTKNHPATRHVMCEMNRQRVGEDGNSLVSSNTVQTFYGGTTMKLLTQSALFPMPREDRKLMVCAGDEATKCLYTWDASTGQVLQKIPIGATALDVCPFNIGGTDYLAAVTDKQIQLCKWVQR